MKKSLVFLGSLLLGLCGVAQADLNDGLIAYYPFNGNANDESGNGHDGVANSAVLTTDRFNQENNAYFFDGNDFVSMGNPPSLRLSEDFTISSWALFTTNSGTDRILSFNQEFGYELGMWDGNPWFAYARKNHRASQVIQPNTWFNLTVTKAGDLIRLYLNGAKILEESNSSTPAFSRELRFGEKSEMDSWWNGKIDDTRFYNRTLTDEEISNLYALESKKFYFQLIEGDFTWQQAKTDAEARGGRLAILDTQAKVIQASSLLENYTGDEIPATLSDLRAAIIGGRRVGGTLRWLDDTLVNVDELQWWRNKPDSEPFMVVWSANVVATHSSTDLKDSRYYGYILELPETPLPRPPYLRLASLYESPLGEAVLIDATPTAGFPAEYTYQWCFNGLKVPAALGGTASSFSIDSLPENQGIWSVTVTNENGSIEEAFDYRIYVDSDLDGLSNGYEELISMTDINNRDSDNDGLTDGEEVNDHNTDPNSLDSDSDGFTDLYEVETDYDPNSAESVPDAQVEIVTAIEVRFNALIGAAYTIEFSSDSENWTTIEDDIFGLGRAVERFYSRKDYPKGFFRVVRTDQ